MNVLISQRQSHDQYGQWIDSLENNYINFFLSFGINLIPVPNSIVNIEQYAKSCKAQGIILSGGGDINPTLYGETKKKGIIITPERDKTEKKLIELGINLELPILGICRGMQFLNVFFGGKLTQNLTDINKSYSTPGNHEVSLISNKLIPKFTGNKIVVSSYHNSGITEPELASELVPFALEKELGIVEGFFHLKHSIVGIQWHPERSSVSQDLDSIIINVFMNKRKYKI